MIDFKELTKEQEDGLRSLVTAMQQTSLADLDHLKNSGVQILTFGVDQMTGDTKDILDFSKLDEETLGVLSYSVELVQKSLVLKLTEEKGDPNEKSVFISNPSKPTNFSRNDLIQEVIFLTPVGLWLLQSHWEFMNTPFKPKKKKFWSRLKFWGNLLFIRRPGFGLGVFYLKKLFISFTISP